MSRAKRVSVGQLCILVPCAVVNGAACGATHSAELPALENGGDGTAKPTKPDPWPSDGGGLDYDGLSYQDTDNELDYGLYWFDERDQSARYETESTNPYYDDARPVVFFIHGQQSGSTARGFRETFRARDIQDTLPEDDPRADGFFTHHEWLADGWNLGVLYWNQFADEAEVKHAEAKIWSTGGRKAMRYRLPDGSYSERYAPQRNLTEEFLRIYASALKNNHSDNIRIVGHSLGNQLATHLVYRLHQEIEMGDTGLFRSIPDRDRLMPKRLALLDPAWTRGGKPYLEQDFNEDGRNDWVGERVRWYIIEMNSRWYDTNKKFVVELYYTTQLDTGVVLDANRSLRQHVAGRARIFLDYFQLWQVREKHFTASNYYFLTYSTPLLDAHGAMVPSANASNEQLQEAKGGGLQWKQRHGKKTISTADDVYVTIRR